MQRRAIATSAKLDRFAIRLSQLGAPWIEHKSGEMELEVLQMELCKWNSEVCHMPGICRRSSGHFPQNHVAGAPPRQNIRKDSELSL
jgi:hypothetical protein